MALYLFLKDNNNASLWVVLIILLSLFTFMFYNL